MSSQQQIDAFKEVSGCTDASEAQNYINACDGNLEQAVNLFFARGTRKRQKTTNSAGVSTSKKPYQAKNGAHNAKDVSTIDLSDDEGNSASGLDDVRAPIAPVQGAIVEQSFQQTYGTHRGPSNPIFEQYHDFRQVAEQQDNNLKRRVAHTSKAVSNDEVVNGRRGYHPHLNNAADDNGVEVTAGPSSSRNFAMRSNGTRNGQAAEPKPPSKPDLKTLFRPPVEIMFQKDWNSALAEARSQNVWLMVNVQMAAEFSCQVLNRDIWSEPTVREVIRGNFLFWQVYHDSPDGVRVRSYYEINRFPAIFIVDPRTGEEVEKLRAQDSVSFLDQVTAFLEKFPSFEARDDAISGRRVEESVSTKTTVSKSPSSTNQTNHRNGEMRQTRKHKHGVTHEAWKSSEADFENSASIEAKRMKRIVNLNDDTDDQMIAEPSTNIPSSSSNAFPGVSADEWKNYVNETKTQSEPVQLLLMLPDGEKHNISVFKATKLKALFLLIAGRGLSPVEHHLVLSFPKRIFNVEDQEKALEEAGFKHQEVVHVEKI